MVFVLEAAEEANFQLLISRFLIVLQKILKYEHEAQILLYPVVPFTLLYHR